MCGSYVDSVETAVHKFASVGCVVVDCGVVAVVHVVGVVVQKSDLTCGGSKE